MLLKDLKKSGHNTRYNKVYNIVYKSILIYRPVQSLENFGIIEGVNNSRINVGECVIYVNYRLKLTAYKMTSEEIQKIVLKAAKFQEVHHSSGYCLLTEGKAGRYV